MVGYSLGLAGLLTMIIQGGLIGMIVKKIGMRKAMMIGFIFTGVGLTLFGLATASWMMFVFLLPFCIGGLATPNIQGIVTNQVPENEQGELQGAITSMVSLTAIIGPLVMTNLFNTFSGKSAVYHIPGMPFLVGAVLVFISLIFAFRAIRKMPKETKVLSTTEIKNEDHIV